MKVGRLQMLVIRLMFLPSWIERIYPALIAIGFVLLLLKKLQQVQLIKKAMRDPHNWFEHEMVHMGMRRDYAAEKELGITEGDGRTCWVWDGKDEE